MPPSRNKSPTPELLARILADPEVFCYREEKKEGRNLVVYKMALRELPVCRIAISEEMTFIAAEARDGQDVPDYVFANIGGVKVHFRLSPEKFIQGDDGKYRLRQRGGEGVMIASIEVNARISWSTDPANRWTNVDLAVNIDPRESTSKPKFELYVGNQRPDELGLETWGPDRNGAVVALKPLAA